MAILTKGTTFADGDQVTSTKLNNLVDAAAFVAGSSGTTDDATLEVAGGQLRVKTIQSGNIASLAVTEGKIGANAVTSAKIAASAVGTTHLADSGVTAAKLATDAVEAAKIKDANVTAAKLSGAQTGTAPVFGVRAWGKFVGQATNGACVVSASGNVSGVSRISDGVYEVTMTTALPDANYAITSTSSGTHVSYEVFTETITQFRLEFRNSSNVLTNPTEIGFMVIR
jgi:hypothetical protein